MMNGDDATMIYDMTFAFTGCCPLTPTVDFPYLALCWNSGSAGLIFAPLLFGTAGGGSLRRDWRPTFGAWETMENITYLMYTK